MAPQEVRGMQNRPERVRRVYGIEQVVGCDHNEAERCDRPNGEVDQSREHNHGPSQRPQDDQYQQVEVEIELPAETADDDQLQKNQPEAASEKESRQFSLRFFSERKKGSGSSEQEEDRCAIVRDPSGEEECRSRRSGIG